MAWQLSPNSRGSIDSLYNPRMASLRHGVEEPGDAQDIRLVVDTIPTLAWSAGPDGSAEFHNQRWLDYTGLSAKQALGSGWELAIHPDDLPRILEVFREALNSGKPYEVEGPFRRFDGEFRWFLFRGGQNSRGSLRLNGWSGTKVFLPETSSENHTAKGMRACSAGLLNWLIITARRYLQSAGPIQV
jgi:PAS domain S-box-containing protein